jgi:hypothetical protein
MHIRGVSGAPHLPHQVFLKPVPVILGKRRFPVIYPPFYDMSATDFFLWIYPDIVPDRKKRGDQIKVHK